MENKKNIYEKLQECRVELQEKQLKKGGKNEYAGFEYFELADFIPTVNELFLKHKLHSAFNITNETLFDGERASIKEIATLKIINVEAPDEVETFTSPTAEANLRGCTPIQSLGGVHTYMKRYLYLNALEIVEHDLLDGITGKEEVEEKKNTKAKTTTKTKTTTKKQAQPTVDEFGFQVQDAKPLITASQLQVLNRQDKKVKDYALKKFGVNSLNELTQDDAQFIIISMTEKGTLK